jgi:quinoprotein glucose dehydrogenase
LGVRDTTVLLDLVKNRQAPPEVRQSAVRALAAQDAGRLADAVTTALADPDERVRAEAIRASAKLPKGLERIQPFLGKGALREQQAALDALGDVPGKQADEMLGKWMDRMLAHQVRGELQLDVLEAAGKRQAAPELAQKLKQYAESKSKSDKLAGYRECLTGGDAAAGDHIFRERADVSCIRCHTLHRQGGIVGPVLDGIGGKQSREYLLESIVDPNAKIAAGFESVILKFKDGRTLTGVVKREDERSMMLVDADNSRNRVNKSEIVTRERGVSAMPEDIVRALSKRDLRDLVEFLADLK